MGLGNSLSTGVAWPKGTPSKKKPNNFSGQATALALQRQGTTIGAVGETMPLGFMKSQRSGPQAMRVPYEAFAGEPDLRALSKYVPPLELIVKAAERTNDYLVFESPLVEILVDWKW